MGYREHLITTIEQLQSLYGEKLGTSVVKEIDYINDGYRKLIEAAPFVTVATSGPEGLDCSPKGDAPGFVHILDDKTLAIPDRPGNNRIDGFRNIVRDPRIALLFLIPGVGETLRVNGRASISIDPDLMQSFAVNGKLPRCVLVVHIESIFFHCSSARSSGMRRPRSTVRVCHRPAPSLPNSARESWAARRTIVRRPRKSRRCFIDSCQNSTVRPRGSGDPVATLVAVFIALDSRLRGNERKAEPRRSSRTQRASRASIRGLAQSL
jgi:PPOX class probable FMN-dependent enzyme